MNRVATTFVLAFVLAAQGAQAQPAEPGPFNAVFLQGGIGIDRLLAPQSANPTAGSPLTMSAWVNPSAGAAGATTLIAAGDPANAYWGIELVDGRLAATFAGKRIVSSTRIAPGQWTHVAATSDGISLQLFANGKRVATATVASASFADRILVAPVIGGQTHFGGSLVSAQLSKNGAVAAVAKARPDFDLVQMWHVGAGWEWQSRANTGLWRQQDPWTLPKASASPARPIAAPVAARQTLEPLGSNRWVLNGWKLAAAPDVKADGATLSRVGADTRSWYAATVPGTVLTTLVDRGVYPDPYYGLDNLAIPEKLARQDYWYRTSFSVPANAAGKRLSLVFGGINYASEIWVNGQRVGGTRGAFIRGRFDLTPVAGENVIAVRVSPPPHPGIPHEQSIAAGVGENGGQLAIDGPTFVATEGWDWIPGIRDRNTGIWRPVELVATGAITIGDPHIVTDLPLPRIDSADVLIDIPVRNQTERPVAATVSASFDGIKVSRQITVPAGVDVTVRFTPATNPELRVANPRLWWPNGYGDPALHGMTIAAEADGAQSDTKSLRFGIREVSYDLSLFDSAGALRRVNVQPTDGRLAGQKLIDVSHTGIKESPRGWAESLTAAGEKSAGVKDIPETLPEPHLALRVNGVRIAARGGNWGMDDALKRVSRERLAPYFRLEREAHMNVVRNWMGNNDEDEFFELADENGIMVLNDFWQSTQNFQVEPQDPALFLANARDTVSRYRNHPSIVLWFGRNEGVPYPMLNEGLDDVLFELDGTRWYTGSSNTVNLQGSGPYNYRPPVGYFTDLATGFSVETGTSSLSTLEAIEASVPAVDRWPLSDTLAYHDWHFGGNGDTKTFMATLDTMFGAGTGLEDFERKAQMMNLETHKAMYEGFLGHLWTKNSGRLLWMTHPSWPSNAWQIYSSDYDTHAAYYGAKKAAEPLHVQLNLPGNELVVVNTTQTDEPGLVATTRVVGLDNEELFKRTEPVSAGANRTTLLAPIPLDTIFTTQPMVLVSLTLARSDGTIVSDNFYWRGKDPASYRALNALPEAQLTIGQEKAVAVDGEMSLPVRVANTGKVGALNVKLTLKNRRGERILPAYYSDNYISLLPGTTKTITVRYPASNTRTPTIAARGWNLKTQTAGPAR